MATSSPPSDRPAGRWSLEQTGTSTNVLSKGAYDLVKLRTKSRRARKIASAAGYVATEIAKEVPYYAGAFGVLPSRPVMPCAHASVSIS